MLIHDNHVHSDLHPGNVFVTFVKQPVIKAISSCLFENHYPHNHLHDEEQSEMIDNETIARLAAIDDEDEWQRATRSLEQENYTPKL